MTYLMLLVLWAAAIYRVVLTVRSPRAVWRTAFTICTVSVALAATLTVYGDPYVEQPVRIWNLTMVLVHLLLLAAAGSCMVYLATLKRTTTPRATVIFWTSLTIVGGIIQITTWALAPIHAQPYEDLITEHGADLFVAIFNASLFVFLMFTTTATAQLCFARLINPRDLTRTISLGLSGVSSAAAAVMFGLWVAAVALRYAGQDFTTVRAAGVAIMPFSLVGLGLGTLSLLLVPPLLDFLRNYRSWRTLQPLWQRLVSLQPAIHLNLASRGTPASRVQTRLQRVVVEIHDALRLTRVDLRPGATIDDLGRALQSPTDHGRAAAELLPRTENYEDDIAQLTRLAQTYARNQTWSADFDH